MGLGVFGSILILTLFFKHLASQQPNTDDFFVSEFLKKMGLATPQVYNFSASVCYGVSCDAKREHVVGLLKSLNLSSNQISGSLTNNIGNFGLLHVFDLSSNNFSGQIPEAISSLMSLKVLKLNHNRFEQRLPFGILRCHSLVSIDLSSNQLSGAIPDGFGDAFPNLITLNLAGNSIHGSDSDISGLKSIVSLNISGNSFHGSVMSLFHGRLEVMDLSRNQFEGLEYLNLSKTSLIGYIPAEISQLSNLSALDVSINHLTGKIPLLSNKNLQVLDLSNNNLSGDVPSSVIEKLPLMEKYNFSYNNLTFCALEIKPAILQTVFYGSVNSFPIAANPSLLKKRATQDKGMKLALALTLSMICLVAGVLRLAFGCLKKTKPWLVKQTSYKEEHNMSGPFSFHTDSTTWVADVKQATSVPVIIFDKPQLNITFADLLDANSNFDSGTLLAEGKFGPVYRGFLPGGIHVAVKVLVVGSTLTDKEAARELEYLGRIKHPNLVPLTGYCVAGDQRIAIYDYMENGNLQNLLYDLPLGVLQRTDDWSTDTWEEDDGKMLRLAVFYLDYNLEPRLSNFRLAKICGSGLDEEIALCSPGYAPPEFYQPEFDASILKSDVYCFGVVLFELLTGKKPVGDDYPDEKESTLVSWVRRLVRKNKSPNAIDRKFVILEQKCKWRRPLRLVICALLTILSSDQACSR
ncbi:hypothetical protein JHK87_033872 [Glycine soja]|nr:hypothetical protein JHK87_033872 [Glycine soja]